MSTASHHPQHSTSTDALPLHEARHQADAVHVPWVMGTIGLLGAMIALCFVFAWGVHAAFSRPGGGQPTRPDTASIGYASAWLHPGADLQRTRAAARQRLGSYGWISREDALVHISIDQAMKIEAQRARRQRRNPSQGEAKPRTTSANPGGPGQDGDTP